VLLLHFPLATLSSPHYNNKSMKPPLFFLFLALFLSTSHLFTPASFCQTPTDNLDERFVGQWETIVEGQKVTVTINKNGTWLSEGYHPVEKTPLIATGEWKVRDDNIVWTYDVDNFFFKAGEEDINRILEVTKDTFIVEEINGMKATYIRVDTNKKACPL